ncbi:MAG: hypothetical protein ACOC22_02155 [bacterium]
MYSKDDKIFIEEEDQCTACKNYKNKALCPLLEALFYGFVLLEGELIVRNCGFYKKYKPPKLKRIK